MNSLNTIETNYQDTIYWAIWIFFKKELEILKYLVVQNTETWNISFVSGAKEDGDKNTIDTANREIREELRIPKEEYELIPTSIRHEFIFWPKKKERAWKKGSYNVFIADWSKLNEIHPSKELTMATWMTKEEVLDALTFEDLKEVFKNVTWEIRL